MSTHINTRSPFAFGTKPWSLIKVRRERTRCSIVGPHSIRGTWVMKGKKDVDRGTAPLKPFWLRDEGWERI